eukprot:TRINITY_DN13388_c0_g1_i1.p1 TRINITY_DN13388_c0_g1~~TRINITY_DN13388_c0_g1_i1.p1  ORF type:complete len:717 (+),score=188.32 TRINITY_DN13388_c0_g1_i1:119-2269(+)
MSKEAKVGSLQFVDVLHQETLEAQKSAIGSHWRELLRSGRHADCALRFKDENGKDQVLSLHQSVLCQLDFFKARFDASGTWSDAGVREVQLLQRASLTSVLVVMEFLYVGSVVLTPRNCLQVYGVAKEMCFQKLIDVCVQHVQLWSDADLLRLFREWKAWEMVSYDELAGQVVREIHRRSRRILPSEAFYSLELSHICALLDLNVFEGTDSRVIYDTICRWASRSVLNPAQRHCYGTDGARHSYESIVKYLLDHLRAPPECISEFHKLLSLDGDAEEDEEGEDEDKEGADIRRIDVNESSGKEDVGMEMEGEEQTEKEKDDDEIGAEFSPRQRKKLMSGEEIYTERATKHTSLSTPFLDETIQMNEDKDVTLKFGGKMDVGSQVTCMVINEQHLAIGTRTGEVMIYGTKDCITHPESVRPMIILKGHKRDVLSLAFDPQEPSILVSGCRGNALLMWMIPSLDPFVFPPVHSGSIYGVRCMLHRRGQCFSCGRDARLVLWGGMFSLQRRRRSGSSLHHLGKGGIHVIHSVNTVAPALCMTCDVGEKSVFVGCGDGMVREFFADSLCKKRCFIGIAVPVRTIHLALGRIWCGTADGSIEWWNVRDDGKKKEKSRKVDLDDHDDHDGTGEMNRRHLQRGLHSSKILSLTYHPECEFVTTDADGIAKMWTMVEDGSCELSFKLTLNEPAQFFIHCPVRGVIFGAWNKQIHFWWADSSAVR